MLEALLRLDASEAAGQRPAMPVPLPEVPPEEPPAEEEEVPFIEIGPRRSVDGSPAVLASLPVPIPVPAPREEERPATIAFRPAAPLLRSVTFRTVPAPAEARFAPELIAFHAPEHAVSAGYRDLLEQILASPALPPAQPALFFTAALVQAGTTTVLLNAAITAARQGRRVVIVDANLRRPALAARLGLADRPGLREVLAGAVGVESAVQPTGLDGLLALPAGAPPGPAGAPPGAETLRSLLRQLRQRCELVLVDGPRWDGRADVTVPGAACDAVFLVVPEQEAETPPVRELLRVIPEQGARLAGCILTGP
jgi:Mrp family chromosome partitioning ATPase